MSRPYYPRISSITATLLAVASLTACKNLGPMIKDGQPVAGGVGNVVNLQQGWSSEEQQLFYFTSQGSQLMPYDWYLVLEEAGSTNRFRSNENTERFKWLASRPTKLNPDGLPVGFVKDVDRDSKRAYLGLTCAACHTSQMEYKGLNLRIDGGPTLADTQRWSIELGDALVATLGSPQKFDRFAHNVLGTGYTEKSKANLRVELRSVREYLVRRNARNASPSPYGHARLDAFGNILNEVMAYSLGVTTNIQPADAPVSFPFLWDTPQSDRVQWNGIAPNRPPGAPPGFGPLGRNVGEVLGVFGKLEIHPTSPPSGYRSSVKMVNLGKLEKWLADLWSPKWPENVLPALDPAKVKRGEALFAQSWPGQESCLSCHSKIVRTDPNRRYQVKMTSIDELGTDPVMVMNFVNRVGGTGKLTGTPKNVLFGSDDFGDSASGADILNSVGLGVILRHPLDAAIGAFEGDVKTYQADIIVMKAYKGRPLNGIWATAPYLHNGSVPNLWELLQRPEQRVKTFHVGSRKFDPVNVGFDTSADTRGTSLLDTQLHANSNGGHLWGTQLSDTEKWDLIEYMKSL